MSVNSLLRLWFPMALMGLVTVSTSNAQSLDIRVELRNQMRYLEVQREGFDNSFLGIQVKMYSATKAAEDYLIAHRLENPIAVVNDSDDDHFGPRLYKLIVSLGKSYRDSQTQRIESLKSQIDKLNAGQLPGYSHPTASEKQHGQNVLTGVVWAENQLSSYANSCDSEEWMHEQIQSTVVRANDIEALVRQMYQAQDEEQRRQARLELERKQREAEEQRQRLAQSLHDHPTRDDFAHDRPAEQHESQSSGPRNQRDTFPLDKPQRDMIGGVMRALDREAHQPVGRPD